MFSFTISISLCACGDSQSYEGNGNDGIVGASNEAGSSMGTTQDIGMCDLNDVPAGALFDESGEGGMGSLEGFL